MVELKDGTKIQHSATDNKGIRSDGKRLILSVLLDGGISYLVFRGINNLRGRFEPQSEGYTEGYNHALADMMMAEKNKNTVTRKPFKTLCKIFVISKKVEVTDVPLRGNGISPIKARSTELLCTLYPRCRG